MVDRHFVYGSDHENGLKLRDFTLNYKEKQSRRRDMQKLQIDSIFLSQFSEQENVDAIKIAEVKYYKG